MERKFLRSLVILALVAAVAAPAGAGGATAQVPASPVPAGPLTPIGTAFTYQGWLTDGGSPADGLYDFRFELYDAESGGNQVGSALTHDDELVTDGQFSVLLDFGSGIFTGEARWLEVGVRPGDSEDPYTTLEPRQPLTPTPYAQHASFAESTSSIPPHDHLGETWTGSGEPLAISGAFGDPAYGALVLDNSDPSGNGLRVLSAGANGLRVDSASLDGVHVDWAGADGMAIGSAGGFGVRIGPVGGHGVYVESAANDGMYVGSATYNGLRVGSAVLDGVHVDSAGADGMAIGSAGGFGVRVGPVGGHGVYVESAASHGMYVGSADDNGLRVDWAGLDGVHIASADGYAGYFGGDIYVGGTCYGCTLAAFGINDSEQTLRTGDVVSIQGISASEFAGLRQLMKVGPAQSGEAVVGVVLGGAESEAENGRDLGQGSQRLVPREGPAPAGEYVAILIYGPAQVRASTSSGPIAAGTRLAAGDGGRAQALRTVEVGGIQVAESAPVLGIALEGLNADGLIWVLVNPQ